MFNSLSQPASSCSLHLEVQTGAPQPPRRSLSSFRTSHSLSNLMAPGTAVPMLAASASVVGLSGTPHGYLLAASCFTICVVMRF